MQPPKYLQKADGKEHSNADMHVGTVLDWLQLAFAIQRCLDRATNAPSHECVLAFLFRTECVKHGSSESIVFLESSISADRSWQRFARIHAAHSQEIVTKDKG